jgi:hypothetical protein
VRFVILVAEEVVRQKALLDRVAKVLDLRQEADTQWGIPLLVGGLKGAIDLTETDANVKGGIIAVDSGEDYMKPLLPCKDLQKLREPSEGLGTCQISILIGAVDLP